MAPLAGISPKSSEHGQGKPKMAIITAADLREYAGLSDTVNVDLINDLIDQVDRMFSTFTGRKLAADDYSYDPDSVDYDQDRSVLDGNDSVEMLLPEWPVNSISALLVDDSEITARETKTGYGYTILKEIGQVRLSGYKFTEGYSNIEVSYNAGYSTIPPDIQQAALKQAAWWYREAPAGNNLLGVMSRQHSDGMIMYHQKYLLPDVQKILSAYTRAFR